MISGLISQKKITIKNNFNIISSRVYTSTPPLTPAGLTSGMLLLDAFVCGNDKAAVYDGSWNEWFQKASPEEMVNVPNE